MSQYAEQGSAMRGNRHGTGIKRQSIGVVIAARYSFEDVKCPMTIRTTNADIVFIGNVAELRLELLTITP